MDKITGLYSDVITVTDPVGDAFLQAFLRAHQESAGKAGAFLLLSALVRAAGGRIEIPRSDLLSPPSGTLRITHDDARYMLILEIKNDTDNR